MFARVGRGQGSSGRSGKQMHDSCHQAFAHMPARFSLAFILINVLKFKSGDVGVIVSILVSLYMT